MTISEILELVQAGYTKAEIESLSGGEIQKENTKTVKQEDTKTEKVKTKETKTEEVKTKETKTEETKETKNDSGYNKLLEVVNSLSETVKAMQADNAKKVSNEQPKTETAESAIRSFFEDIPKN